MSALDHLPETKVCSVCRLEKPREEFYLRRRPKTGRFYLRSACRSCQMDRLREYRERVKADPERHEKALEKQRKRHGEWRDFNREHLRAKDRAVARRRRAAPETAERIRENSRRYEARKAAERRADPAAREAFLARKREAYAIRRDKAGKEPRKLRAHGRLNHSSKRGIPIGPFREWLRSFIDQERQEDGFSTAVDQIAAALGKSRDTADRQVYRWLNESEVVPLDYADAVLTRLDSPARLYELWPELEEVS